MLERWGLGVRGRGKAESVRKGEKMERNQCLRGVRVHG